MALFARSAAYGALVFGGMALLGFVLLPVLGFATGWIPVFDESRGMFSMLTLRSVPYLFGLSLGSAYAYPRVAGVPLRRRAALYGANVLIAYALAATVAALT